jgi:hypothetical protein
MLMRGHAVANADQIVEARQRELLEYLDGETDIERVRTLTRMLLDALPCYPTEGGHCHCGSCRPDHMHEKECGPWRTLCEFHGKDWPCLYLKIPVDLGLTRDFRWLAKEPPR